MNKCFNTVIGSLVMDETTPIVLLMEAGHVEDAVRDLVRIGYDTITGYATPDTLERYFEDGGATASIEEITFGDVARMKETPGTAVLDVRFASEYASAHVPDALNASYTRLPAYVEDRVPQELTLLVHCAGGARAAAASAFLAREGYDVKYVNGAFGEYAEAYEVEAGLPDVVAA
jgi:hydroxyacylglutathione hydrolase